MRGVLFCLAVEEIPTATLKFEEGIKMEIYLICLASALIGGLMLSRLTKLLVVPAWAFPSSNTQQPIMRQKSIWKALPEREQP